jgi:thiol:disulfide interchange protein DsbD
MDHDVNNLINPVAYTPDPEEYNNWLKKGIENFRDN